MREFSEADLLTGLATAAVEADRSPVAILKDGEPRYVLMTIERFRRMQLSDPRKVYRTSEAPPEVKAFMLAAIDEFLGEEDKEPLP